jgi:hypothetical protein
VRQINAPTWMINFYGDNQPPVRQEFVSLPWLIRPTDGTHWSTFMNDHAVWLRYESSKVDFDTTMNVPSDGVYEVLGNSDDEGTLYVDGNMVMHVTDYKTPMSEQIYLTAGQHTLKMVGVVHGEYWRPRGVAFTITSTVSLQEPVSMSTGKCTVYRDFKCRPGDRVKRGPDWNVNYAIPPVPIDANQPVPFHQPYWNANYANQDWESIEWTGIYRMEGSPFGDSLGTITGTNTAWDSRNSCCVMWDKGSSGCYRVGDYGAYDLCVVTGSLCSDCSQGPCATQVL